VAISQADYDRLRQRAAAKAEENRELRAALEAVGEDGGLTFGRVAMSAANGAGANIGGAIAGATFDALEGNGKTIATVLGALATIGGLFVRPGGWGELALSPLTGMLVGTTAIRVNRMRG